MDKVIFIPSAVLGLIFVVIYSFNCYRNKREFNYQVMFNSILQASGIVCGILLILSTFFVDLKQYLNNIDIYILIAGLAVLVVSIRTVYSDIGFGNSNNLSESVKDDTAVSEIND